MAAAQASTAGRPAPPPARRGPQRHASAVRAAASGRDNEPELDLAVFRFTLGIPGFDDALIPRVVGALGAALLALNHVLTESAVSGAQLRTEALGAALAGVALAAPTLERRLKEADPGRGRRPLPETLDGAAAAFAIASDLPDTVKEVRRPL